MEMIRKNLSIKADDFDKDQQQFIVTISDDTVDSYKEVMNPNGVDLERYKQNPVILFGHDHDQPIGKALWVKNSKNKLIAKAQISKKTQFARDIYNLIEDGVLNASSVGFMPVKGHDATKDDIKKYPGVEYVHDSWELYEFSIVSVPANPNALINVRSTIAEETYDILKSNIKIEENTKDYDKILTNIIKEKDFDSSKLIERLVEKRFGK